MQINIPTLYFFLIPFATINRHKYKWEIHNSLLPLLSLYILLVTGMDESDMRDG